MGKSTIWYQAVLLMHFWLMIVFSVNLSDKHMSFPVAAP